MNKAALPEFVLAFALWRGSSGNSRLANPIVELADKPDGGCSSSTGISVNFFPEDLRKTSDHDEAMRDMETALTKCTDADQAPTPEVLALARVILGDSLGMNLRPTRVNISIDGGAIVQFVRGQRYADIELLNTGEVMGVITEPGIEPTVWTIDTEDPAWSTVSLETILGALNNAPCCRR